MTQCTDGTWCCGARNFTNCCDQKLGFELKAELVTFNAEPVTVSVTQSSVPTVTVAVTQSSILKVTEAAAAATSTVIQVVYRTRDDKSTSTKITGLTIGLVLAAIVGAGAGYGLGRGKWRKERQDDEKPINLGNNDGAWGIISSPNPPMPQKWPEPRISVYEVGQYPRFSRPPVELGSGK